MRTTIRLPDDLLTEVKEVAVESGSTLTDVVADALRAMLAQRQIARERLPVRLTTVSGHGPQPGVDLDDSAALLA
jgi:metal-responsive CopG/Arc/MetJ family transcriptional regulator